MRLVEIVPLLAGVLAAAFVAWRALAQGPPPPAAWRWPAGAAALLALWSLGAVLLEGPLGFWPEHTRNLWGNQIWFDLLLAAATAFALMVPRARAVGMLVPLWGLLVLVSGSIGLLAMAARLLHREEQVSHAGGSGRNSRPQ